ncbi:hypothetical protein HQ545_06195 [Candidatus Woesearchaeota archaeon]|nr:hypothetical protein [Candidatus Woesearchaeota archaeon]
MAWEAEPIKHILKCTHTGEDGRDFTDYQEYTPKANSTVISLQLFNDDVEVRVRPHTLEHLKQCVEETYKDKFVSELFVGIRDGNGIAYVGKLLHFERVDHKEVRQYFFKNDEPSSFNFGNESGPEWPVNQPPILDYRLMQYFTELKEIRPDVTGSLDACMDHLIIGRPKYSRKFDDCAEIILR